MSWAAKRDTTRPEDEAYCLMGLFDVKIPLLYGEGRYAFKRLQEQIVKITGDSSLLAWRVPPHLAKDRTKSPDRLSAPSPAHFKGCERFIIKSLWMSRNEPWFMSNLGLTMTATLMLDGPKQCLVLVDCGSEQNPDQVLAIRTKLEYQSSLTDVKRLFPVDLASNPIVELNWHDLNAAKDTRMQKSVLLSRTPHSAISLLMHELKRAPVILTLDVALSGRNLNTNIEIEDYYPSKAWDERKLTVMEGSPAVHFNKPTS